MKKILKISIFSLFAVLTTLVGMEHFAVGASLINHLADAMPWLHALNVGAGGAVLAQTTVSYGGAGGSLVLLQPSRVQAIIEAPGSNTDVIYSLQSGQGKLAAHVIPEKSLALSFNATFALGATYVGADIPFIPQYYTDWDTPPTGVTFTSPNYTSAAIFAQRLGLEKKVIFGDIWFYASSTVSGFAQSLINGGNIKQTTYNDVNVQNGQQTTPLLEWAYLYQNQYVTTNVIAPNTGFMSGDANIKYVLTGPSTGSGVTGSYKVSYYVPNSVQGGNFSRSIQ